MGETEFRRLIYNYYNLGAEGKYFLSIQLKPRITRISRMNFL